ncbi:MAG: 2-oxo acid dehydrogenase subunit E2 [Bacteroidales bacterium]|nr:2-oxo acid dehydrogenase subunit E2 [Bacteroidales bacterium]
MSTFNIVMPKMGESVQEATITKWFKKEGDAIEEEDVLLEIATDKVDSEIPSPVDGVIKKIFFKENDVVAVGEIIAIVALDGDEGEPVAEKEETIDKVAEKETPKVIISAKESVSDFKSSGRFYSPLVQSIAQKENISSGELDNIKGTGQNGRVRKQDILAYLENKGKSGSPSAAQPGKAVSSAPKVTVNVNPGDQVVQMDRMRKLIAEHMVMSKQVSPHVTNFIEADVTNIVIWRNKVKDEFFAREKQKITFMPIFTEATAKALKAFPGINASVDGDTIILRKNINIGFAVALPSGNLIVPVVKNVDQKNLLGITSEINRLAADARNNKLNPDDIQGGTFTISNFGTFQNLTGTPIINQPQVAILAVGNIEKKPAVLETPSGDVIAIRHKMILSLSYDHRVVDGALAGAFLKSLADDLGNFDVNTSF